MLVYLYCKYNIFIVVPMFYNKNNSIRDIFSISYWHPINNINILTSSIQCIEGKKGI